MDIFSCVRKNCGLLGVVNQYTTMMLSPTGFTGFCPFACVTTEDATFSVDAQGDTFSCSSCNSTGDVIGFVSKINNCSDIEAVQMLIKQSNIKIPEAFITALSEKPRE